MDEKPVANTSTEPPEALKDGSSFADLIRPHLGWLRGWLGARLRGHEEQEIDDLCQDILLRAVRGRAMLRRPERFPAWLYRIAANILRDYLRKRKRSRERERIADLESEPADPKNLEAALERDEELDRLVQAVLKLPRIYREPMVLRHVQDLSYAEVARILGTSENSVQVRIFRARQMLRRQLLAEEPRLEEKPGVNPLNANKATLAVW